jgi:hypothetical protein
LNRLSRWDHEPSILVNVKKPAIKAFFQATPQWLQDITNVVLIMGCRPVPGPQSAGSNLFN